MKNAGLIILFMILILMSGAIVLAESNTTPTDVPTTAPTADIIEIVPDTPTVSPTEIPTEMVTQEPTPDPTLPPTPEPTVTATPTGTQSPSDGDEIDQGTNTTPPESSGSIETPSGSFSSESIDPDSSDSGSSPEVIALGEIVITATGTKLSSSGGTGYTYSSDDGGYYIITSSGDYYLDDDLSTSHSFAIEIQASSVTLDGNGKEISGSYSGIGVKINSGSDDVTVQNFGSISGFDSGIESWGDDTTIRNNVITDNTRGIYVAGDNAVLDGNTINDNWIQGIQSSGVNARITNNTVERSTLGIESNGKGANLSGNTLTDNSYGISAGGENDIVSDNIIQSSVSGSGKGIDSWGINATISGNSVEGFSYGIDSSGSNASLSENTIHNNLYYGIYSTGSAATISDNDVSSNEGYANIYASGDDAIITSNNANSGLKQTNYGIQSTGRNARIEQNFASNNKKTGILATGPNVTIVQNTVSYNGDEGIRTTQDNATIEKNTVTGNDANAGIYVQYGKNAKVRNNSVSGNLYGIYVEENNGQISGNTVYNNTFGIFDRGSDAIITDNTVYNNSWGIQNMDSGIESVNVTIKDNQVSQNVYGIAVTDSYSNVVGNTVRENQYGMYLPDSIKSAKITGNTIRNNDIGIQILNDGGTGNGLIADNYLGNIKNVDGDGNAGVYDWSITPTPGTNIVGGPNLAGNFWSNSMENGWSDNQAGNSTGYTTTPYELTTGVYDYAPLVRTASPTPTPTPSPDPTTSPSDPSSSLRDASREDRSPDVPLYSMKMVSVSLPSDVTPGSSADLIITLENTGRLSPPAQSTIRLAPVNDLAKKVGEIPADLENGQYVLICSLTIPKIQGSYQYLFQPVLVTIDPTTGKEVRVPIGDPVNFTIIVSETGTVAVIRN